MRKIEFRGYVIEELTGAQQWVTGFGVGKIEYTDGTNSVFLSTPHGEYIVDEKSVGQYTGLKDKNGKKIFEGDIVKIINQVTENLVNGKVIFQYGYFAVEYGWNTHLLMDFESQNIEVIGNTYDNPELLNS